MHDFVLWAPKAHRVQLQLQDQVLPMNGPDAAGYWRAMVDWAETGMSYGFLLDDDAKAYPDPRSCDQPDGVHTFSRIYSHDAFAWTDAGWWGCGLEGAVLYEMHPGTFTPSGTLDAAVERIEYLVELGVTHVEIMPVAQADGDYGWGYDGVGLYAVHRAYGGPDALKRFVNACHAAGLAVLLDVVYNHFGPVGNYTAKFGPYLTDIHHTPWGGAINFEGRGSDEVRRFFVDNALMWMRDFHIDGLRLDAVHEIIDRSAVHFLEQLSTEVRELKSALRRRLLLIAESDLNDAKLVTPVSEKGLGLDAQWSDDFHHALFTVLHEEQGGYYDDFGTLAALAKAIQSVFVYDGRYSAYRNRHHGRPVDDLSGNHFVVCIQNHDQIGNRAVGERLEHLVGVARTKIALALLLTSPYIPLLFQGEEFAASAPFQYFTHHEDPELAKAVSAGRKREFAAFGWDPKQIPDPNAPETFLRSKLNWDETGHGVHAEILEWTRQLIRFRRETPALHHGDRAGVVVTFDEEARWLRMRRSEITVIINLGTQPYEFKDMPKAEVLLASSFELIRGDRGLLVGPDSIVIVREVA